MHNFFHAIDKRKRSFENRQKEKKIFQKFFSFCLTFCSFREKKNHFLFSFFYKKAQAYVKSWNRHSTTASRATVMQIMNDLQSTLITKQSNLELEWFSIVLV